MPKYILFHSTRCAHSKQIENNLRRSAMNPDIYYITIESLQNIPDYITRVPSLVVSKKEIYIGNNILDWIGTKLQMPQHRDEPAQKTVKSPNSLEPMSTIDYTFLTGNEAPTDHGNTFTLLDMPIEPIQMIQEKEDNRKCTSKEYEEYIKNRSKLTADMNRGPMPPPSSN